MFDHLMFSGYLNQGGQDFRPKGIRTYECMAAHKEALEIDQTKRWENRSLSESRATAWKEYMNVDPKL